MTHLLGSKNCVESLQRDVIDVQDTVKNVLEKIGVYRAQSWKYPDKQSMEVDVPLLLQNYSYSKDTEFNKIAHVVLIELVIDRLLFLFQCVTQYLELTINGTTSDERPKSKTIGSTMSIGLTVKKYWSKVSHLHSLHQVLNDKIEQLESDRSKALTTAHDLENKLYNKDINTNISLNSQKDLTSSIKDVNNQQTQTLETSFMSCENCNSMQKSLITVSLNVVSLCNQLNVQSILKKDKSLRLSAGSSYLASNAHTRIVNKQQTDIESIEKYFEHMKIKLKNHETEIISNKLLIEKLKLEVNEAKEINVKTTQDFDAKLLLKFNELENVKNEVEEGEKKRSNLQSEVLKLCKKCACLKEELSSRKRELSNSESVTETLREQLDEEQKEKTELNSYKQQYETINFQFNQMKEEYTSIESILKQTNDDNESLKHHHQTMETNHNSLIERVHHMEKECNELINKLKIVEEEKSLLDSKLNEFQNDSQSVRNEYEQMKISLENLQSENLNLQDRIQSLQMENKKQQNELTSTKEQLDIVMNYPSFDTGFQSQTNSSQHRILDAIDFDVPTEMQRQISANRIRIQSLSTETQSLENTLSQLLSAQKNDTDNQGLPYRKEDLCSQKDTRASPADRKSKQEQSIVTKQEEIAVNNKLNDIQMFKWSDKPLHQSNMEKKTYRKGKNYVCGDCRRSFGSEIELQTHATFCFGAL